MYSKATICPGTAPFDVMAVLAKLKLSNQRDYLHLHANAQTHHAPSPSSFGFNLA